MKAAPAPMEEKSSSSSRDAKTRLTEDVSSTSSLYPEELQGFTSASDIYSVRVLLRSRTCPPLKTTNVSLFSAILPDEAKESRSRPEGFF